MTEIGSRQSNRYSTASRRRGRVPARTPLLTILASVSLLLSACAPVLEVYAQPSRIVVGEGVDGRRAQQVDIPPGHLPPPGMCRIWFPGRPPGQQPPPGDCEELRHRLPPEAVLVYG